MHIHDLLTHSLRLIHECLYTIHVQAANVLATVQKDNIAAKGGTAWTAEQEAEFKVHVITHTSYKNIHM